MRRIAFDAAHFPLRGFAVIEASAGTGKTHALTRLWLRAVIERQLPPRQVLMLSFTEKAVRELRQRLAGLLHAAEQALATRAPPVLAEELARLVPSLSADELLRRTRAAKAAFDEAAVTTLHGFCRRVFAEFGPEFRVAGDEVELDRDDGEYLQAIADFWRHEALGTDGLSFVAAFATPAALKAMLGRIPLDPDARWMPDADAGSDSCELTAPTLSAIERSQVESLMIGSVAAERAQLLKAALRDYFAAPESAPSSVLDGLHARVSDVAASKRGAIPAIAKFAAALHVQRAQARNSTGRQALNWLRRFGEFHQSRKARLRQIDHDDLLRRLADALRADSGQLAEQLRRRWPVAMIDEFQDTDLLQFRTFERIYRGGEDHALVVVGDPKQSIYRFRGGDVFAYQAALADVTEVHELNCSYRADAALVEAQNHWFTRVENPFSSEFIRYPIIQPARTEPRQMMHDPMHPQALQLIEVGERGLVKTKLAAAVRPALRAEVQRLLADCRIGSERLRPCDIAVLTHSNFDAEMHAADLRAAGIPVAMQARDSVLATDECDDLMHFLKAMAEPHHAAATRMLALTRALSHEAGEPRDASELGRQVLQWARRFQQGQAAIVLREWRLAAAPNWRAAPDGVQRLMHAEQLCEALLADPLAPTAPTAALDWLMQSLADGGAGFELRRLRDPQAVAVTTIHKSKGLEFGVVLLPSLWYPREADNDGLAVFHDSSGQWMIDAGSPRFEEAKKREHAEAMAERTRLAYVALTRAKHRCILFVAAPKRSQGSALDALYPFVSDPVQSWTEIAAGCGDIGLRAASKEWPEPARTTGVEEPEVSFLPAPARREALTRIHSFSRLVAPGVQADWPSARTEDRAPGLSAARFGECVHAVLEQIEFSRWPDIESEAECVAVCARFGASAPEREAVRRIVHATLMSDLGAGLRLCQVPAPRRWPELSFLLPLSGARVAQLLQRIAADPVFAPLAAFADPSLNLHGFMRGYIDLVFEHGSQFFVLDYKTNDLGTGENAYGEAALNRSMQQHRYGLQALLYVVAVHRWLRHCRGAAYRYERDFGSVIYVFQRGLQSGQGVWRVKPDAGLIADLDRLLDEGR